MAEREYVMGQSEENTQRLVQRAQTLELPLRRLLEDAGLSAGMRVLDLGSGPGDVAMTAAKFVGEAGSVVGVELNSAAVATARAGAGSWPHQRQLRCGRPRRGP